MGNINHHGRPQRQYRACFCTFSCFRKESTKKSQHGAQIRKPYITNFKQGVWIREASVLKVFSNYHNNSFKGHRTQPASASKNNIQFLM